mmetsp:Transcript_6870/g.11011  ORF Transcript_6870/g.11011 Transcript_6870/m.11011 type:complete len:397 (-) Transcript_6870:856-2046(-)
MASAAASWTPSGTSAVLSAGAAGGMGSSACFAKPASLGLLPPATASAALADAALGPPASVGASASAPAAASAMATTAAAASAIAAAAAAAAGPLLALNAPGRPLLLTATSWPGAPSLVWTAGGPSLFSHAAGACGLLGAATTAAESPATVASASAFTASCVNVSMASLSGAWRSILICRSRFNDTMLRDSPTPTRFATQRFAGGGGADVATCPEAPVPPPQVLPAGTLTASTGLLVCTGAGIAAIAPAAADAAAAGEEALSTGDGGAARTAGASALTNTPCGDRLVGESGEQRNDAICAVSSALPSRATVSTSSTLRLAQGPATAVAGPALPEIAWTATPVATAAFGAATLAAATAVESAADVVASGVAPGTVVDVEDEANEACRYLPRESTSSSA